MILTTTTVKFDIYYYANPVLLRYRHQCHEQVSNTLRKIRQKKRSGMATILDMINHSLAHRSHLSYEILPSWTAKNTNELNLLHHRKLKEKHRGKNEVE